MTTPLGSIVTDDNRAAIIMQRRFPHPIEAVWAALTMAEQLASWMGPAMVDGRMGGMFVIEGGPTNIPVEHRRSTGRILVWEPPHVLEYEWRQAIVEASTVRYELVADGDGTMLKLTRRWLSIRNAQGFIPGQHAYLDRLAAYLDGTEIPDWSERYALAQPAYTSV
jgi:uncharacterized protein YndB with AHSA1/START domain